MLELDELITEAMPNRSRTLWQGTFWGGTEQSIIGYGDLTQPRPRGPDVEWFIVGLARQKNYMSVYVNAAENDGYLLARYSSKLGNIKTGSANITIKKTADLDLDGFRELLTHANRICKPDQA